MKSRPYFTISKSSFEKNAGYKTTVHALAELIDNSFEAMTETTPGKIAILLMVNREHRLLKIGVVDNGKGMPPEILQSAICEKSGEYLDRQHGGGAPSRRKFGKYGVGLPKASISQCNLFTLWSWTTKGYKNAHRNQVNIEDQDWIKKGALIPPSVPDAAPKKWLEVAGMDKAEHGTLVLWESLDGLTWSRARWGQHSGLIPNLEFHVGRVYRKQLAGPKPDLTVSVYVIGESFNVIENLDLKPNDPLYTTEGCDVPRYPIDKDKKIFWPSEDPLFDDITPELNSLPFEIRLPDGKSAKVTVTYRMSVAKKNTFAQYGGKRAGNLPYGEHAAKNVGLSLLREGREVDMSLALAVPSEPRERWFGVEFDIPHDLDSILGMTNNKQSYTRLEQVLRQEKKDFLEDGESTDQCIRRLRTEDPQLAVCLELAWKMQEVWKYTKSEHLKMREQVIQTDQKGNKSKEQETPTPEGTAEKIATDADKKTEKPKPDPTPSANEERRLAFIKELTGQGVPQREAEQLAARIVERGLTYAIINKSNLGSPFFNVRDVVDARIIELNQDHPVHPFLLSSMGDESEENIEEIRGRLKDAKIAMMLMLEAWAKIETQAVQDEKRKLQRMREDWGRWLEDYVRQMQSENKL